MRPLLGSALLLLSLASQASVPLWQVDPVHSKLLVAVEHAGFSQSLALMPVSAGVLHYDPEQPDSSRVEVVLQPARLDFGDERWNAAVHGSGLLAVDNYPEARFRSDKVTLDQNGDLLIDGTLELRGVSLPLQLRAQRNGQRRHPLPPFRQTVGFSATTELSRSAFGADAWPGMVGDTVQIRIELEATRERNAELAPLTPDQR